MYSENWDQLLPQKKDVFGMKRISFIRAAAEMMNVLFFSNDGLIFATYDH